MFILCDGACDVAGKDEGKDDEEGALADLGRRPVHLISVLQRGEVVGGTGRLDQCEADHDHHDDGDVLAVEKAGVHGQPAVVLCPVALVLEAHVEENDEGGDAPADDNVLLSGEEAALLDYAGDHGVHMEGLKQEEGEGHGEKVVDEDGKDAAFDGHRFPVGRGEEADVGRQQGYLLAHLDDAVRVKDLEDKENKYGDREESDDDGRGGASDGSGYRFSLCRQRGNGSGRGRGRGRNNAGAVVGLHDGTHLTRAADHGVLLRAQQGVALGKLGTLVGEAGVGAVGVVPDVWVVGVVGPGVAFLDGLVLGRVPLFRRLVLADVGR